jgi:predicted  nucleic acid-binding Zn-ribbon protein
MNQATYLYRLQIIDTQIDQVSTRLLEIQKQLDSDKTVVNAEDAHKEVLKAYEKARNELKNIEHTVSDQQIKVEQSESSLYGGKVKNPKELQDLQREIASVKKHIRELEDQQLDMMVQVEQLENSLSSSKEVYQKAQADFINKSALLLGEKDQLTKKKERLEVERNAGLSSISPDMMSIYNRLRVIKGKIAVALVDDSSCSACGAVLTPSEWQNARSPHQVVYCYSCGRILYAG